MVCSGSAKQPKSWRGAGCDRAETGREINAACIRRISGPLQAQRIQSGPDPRKRAADYTSVYLRCMVSTRDLLLRAPLSTVQSDPRHPALRWRLRVRERRAGLAVPAVASAGSEVRQRLSLSRIRQVQTEAPAREGEEVPPSRERLAPVASRVRLPSRCFESVEEEEIAIRADSDQMAQEKTSSARPAPSKRHPHFPPWQRRKPSMGPARAPLPSQRARPCPPVDLRTRRSALQAPHRSGTSFPPRGRLRIPCDPRRPVSCGLRPEYQAQPSSVGRTQTWWPSSSHSRRRRAWSL